jgi:RND superfamily putative drug exporter
MSRGPIERLASLGFRRRGLVLGLSIALVACAVPLAAGAPAALTANEGNDFIDPGSESARADDRLERAAGEEPNPGLIVLVRPGGGRIGDAQLDRQAQQALIDAQAAGTPEAFAAADGAAAAAAAARSPQALATIERLRKQLERDRVVTRVTDYAAGPAPSLLSEDGKSTYLAVNMKPDSSGAVDRLTKRLERTRGVHVGGPATAQPTVGRQVADDITRAEMIAFPILLVISFFVFRSLVAALLPLLVGGITIVATLSALQGMNGLLPLSIFSVNFVTGLGLGLAIDYSLLVVSRYREEIAVHGGAGWEPLRRTMATAGRTVVFSGITVALAAATLCVFPMRFLYSMGIGGAICALLSALVAVSVLPAILALLGTRVNSLAPRRWRERKATTNREGRWYRHAHRIMKRPGLVAVVATAGLLLAGVPFLRAEFTGVDARVLPKDSSPRIVHDALERDFPASAPSITLAVTAPANAVPSVNQYAAEVARVKGIESVAAPEHLRRNVWRIQLTPERGQLSAATFEAIRDIRARDPALHSAVTGFPAAYLDQEQAVLAGLPLALALLCASTIIVLFLMTGSVILPVKAVIMNLLGVCAAFGFIVLVFQDGNLEGLLAFKSLGAIDTTQPVLLFAMAFGLATDYGTFLLTRIKEEHDAGLPNREAVAVGLERTGRIVTAAAILFSIAVGAFATSEIIFIKLVGVGTVAAVLLDAFVIRTLLVPALMALLGDWNWWAPGPLRRLHERFGFEDPTLPGPAALPTGPPVVEIPTRRSA